MSTIDLITSIIKGVFLFFIISCFLYLWYKIFLGLGVFDSLYNLYLKLFKPEINISSDARKLAKEYKNKGYTKEQINKMWKGYPNMKNQILRAYKKLEGGKNKMDVIKEQKDIIKEELEEIKKLTPEKEAEIKKIIDSITKSTTGKKNDKGGKEKMEESKEETKPEEEAKEEDESEVETVVAEDEPYEPDKEEEPEEVDEEELSKA